MKKYGILACAAFMTLLNGRLDAAVESDVVGYTTITMKAGNWYMIGNPFADLNEGETIKINTAYANGFTDGDVLMVFDTESSGYNLILNWRSEANEGKGAWCDRPVPIPEPEADMSSTIKLGDAVFIQKAVTSNVTFSGLVKETIVEFGSTSSNSWSQISIGWPEEIKLSDLAWENVQENDVLMIFDPEESSYTNILNWRTEAIDANGVVKAGWADRPAPIPEAELIDVSLPIGRALFINKVSAEVGKVSLIKE